MPVIVGRGLAVAELGTDTRLSRHTPRPGSTFPLEQVVLEHVPPFNTPVELEHARQPFGPGPEQLLHEESQDLQDEEVGSKYSDWEQVGKQRPDVNTGLDDGQVEH